MLAAALSHERVKVVAVADPRIADLPLDSLPASVKRFADLEALLRDAEVDAIHVATPTPYHLEHASAILRAGKSVIVEKPMVANRHEADRLLQIDSETPGALIVGHSSSFEPEVQAATSLVHEPEFGEIVNIVSIKSTEWLRRPRLPDELDPAMGGGLLRRQGVHQVDTIRTILGGGPLSVAEASIRLDRGRADLGSFTAWLRSPTGQSIILFHDGVGGIPMARASAPRQSTRPSRDDEMDEKRRRSDMVLEMLLSGKLERVVDNDRGETIVLGTKAELRITSQTVVRTDDDGEEIIDLSAMPSGHHAVLDELVSVLSGGTAFHNCSWGFENLRICEEIEARAKAG
jgi:phthalate 4,5-cis-dihydrodiol dehydrogenase